jgi:signal peptidase II
MGWLAVALIVVLIDQASKMYFNGALQYGQRINVLPVFDFTLMFNKGAAFSFLASEPGWQRWFFTGLSLTVSTVIVALLWRNAAAGVRLPLALAGILGGALGNVVDRVLHGHVIDFLLFYWRDWYYPAFNVADMAITGGAILLVVDEILRARRRPRPG